MKMYKLFALSILVSCATLSCENAPDPDKEAEHICNCWKEVNRAPVDMEQQVADSCTTLYQDVLNKLGDDKEAKKHFVEAYDYCRDHPEGH